MANHAVADPRGAGKDETRFELVRAAFEHDFASPTHHVFNRVEREGPPLVCGISQKDDAWTVDMIRTGPSMEDESCPFPANT